MNTLFDFDIFQAGLFFCIVLVTGDLFSRLAKRKVPGILFSGILFLALSWAGLLPEGLFESTGFSSLTTLVTGMIIVSMGASMSIQAFLSNWRVVVLAVITYLCQVAALILVAGSLFGFQTAIGGLPGGSMTALVIQQRAAELGLDKTIILSVLFYSTQSIPAFFISGHYVEKEARRLLSLPRNAKETSLISSPVSRKISFFDASAYGNFLKAYIICWLASRAGALTGINQFIFCMLFGVAAAALGFMDRDTLPATGMDKAGMFIMMTAIISGYGRITPALLSEMAIPLLVVLGLETVVVFTVPSLIGRLLGFTRDMSISLGSNMMMGFPINMIISNEIAASLTDDPEEQSYLNNEIATRMVIAGLSTTTSLAVLMGGVMANLM